MSQARRTDRPNLSEPLAHAGDLADLLDEFDTASDPARREELRDQVIVVAVPIADRLARRYRRSGVPLEDLEQVARAAMVQAAQRFKGGGAKAFLGYVVPSILGELKRYFRDSSWAIRPPRRIQEAHLSVRQAREDLHGELGREPTVDELAAATDFSVETVQDVQIAAERCWPESLDRPRTGDGGSGVAADKLGVHDRGLEQADARLLVEPALQHLKPREREVIYLRYYQDRTQREVGQRIGLSQMQISRIETKAMERLREAVDPNDDAAA
jgi:RNA polymerase sigma-B factor